MRRLKWLPSCSASRLQGHRPQRSGKDAKTLLQEYLQGRKVALPQYAVFATHGRGARAAFQVECDIPDLEYPHPPAKAPAAAVPNRRPPQARLLQLGSEINERHHARFRSGFIAIVGRPNVGQSTLLNHLIGQKISITSRKAQTTRHRITGILTDEHSQFVFVDTPGFQTKHANALNRGMNQVVTQALTRRGRGAVRDRGPAFQDERDQRC